ncbi:MAG: CoA transferase, partial [Acidimicrobiaceae bacterium]|nr:CoA transferase [Acidimicrobiaceae bacterium]
MAGPLRGIRVVELQGRGPGPFGAMILADLGAEVVRVGRLEDVDPGEETDAERMLRGHRKLDLLTRGRRAVAIDLKHPDGLDAARRLIDRADVVIEGFRPGVAERLGVGPDVCLDRNPRLIYARITGWGRDGPYASMPGHDINYVALAGALDALRPRPGEPPHPPLNLLGDFAGGGMLLVIGVLGALVERAGSGRGQVVDTAMVDGVALLTTIFHGLRAEGLWSDVPATNVLDLGTPGYNVYETADGKYVSVGGGEPQFYAELLRRLDLADDPLFLDRDDPSTWAEARHRLGVLFKSKTRDEWCATFEGTDVCFAPVLSFDEAPAHPHNSARKTFVEVDGVVQPAAAPRFGRTPAAVPGPPTTAGQHTNEVLLDWGFTTAEVDALQ